MTTKAIRKLYSCALCGKTEHLSIHISSQYDARYDVEIKPEGWFVKNDSRALCPDCIMTVYCFKDSSIQKTGKI